MGITSVRIYPAQGPAWCVAVAVEGQPAQVQPYVCRSAALAAGIALALRSGIPLEIEGKAPASTAGGAE